MAAPGREDLQKATLIKALLVAEDESREQRDRAELEVTSPAFIPQQGEQVILPNFYG